MDSVSRRPLDFPVSNNNVRGACGLLNLFANQIRGCVDGGSIGRNTYRTLSLRKVLRRTWMEECFPKECSAFFCVTFAFSLSLSLTHSYSLSELVLYSSLLYFSFILIMVLYLLFTIYSAAASWKLTTKEKSLHTGRMASQYRATESLTELTGNAMRPQRYRLQFKLCQTVSHRRWSGSVSSGVLRKDHFLRRSAHV